MVLKYKEYDVELLNDELFTIGSSDNKFVYDFEYHREPHSNTKHSVLLQKNNEIVKSAILFGNAGQSTIHSKSAIVFDDMLVVCVSNKVFCLYLPSLKLRWAKEIDEATCFQIFKTSESYLIHGELNISKLDFNGNIIWQFSGEDIFVSPESGDVVKLTSRGIEITDWNGKEYLLGYDGKLLN